MPATGPQLPVTNVAWTAVIALSYCNKIRVQENRGVASWPNGDYLVCKTTNPSDKLGLIPPPTSPNSVRIGSGDFYMFETSGKFSPGQVVGYIQMVPAVSTSFDQDESHI